MMTIIDLDRYPLDLLDREAGEELVARCKADLDAAGMFNLEGFLTPAAITTALSGIKPVMAGASFAHSRNHNIYFRDNIPELAPDHPALRRCETVNHTVCADQIRDSLLMVLYQWPPFAAFLAAVMEKPIHTMADPLAQVNVLEYHDGEALNWHFDRSEFTTTLLLQTPGAGGDFEYRSNLRSDGDPNYDGVARLLEGHDPAVEKLQIAPGTLNVFRGKNTAHRVTPVKGARSRIIAVFSFYDCPGVAFSDEERIGFYGRTA